MVKTLFLKNDFPGVSGAKINEGIFIDLQIRKLMADQDLYTI